MTEKLANVTTKKKAGKEEKNRGSTEGVLEVQARQKRGLE